MAFHNMFDLGPCDVYVRYNSITEVGPGELVLVAAADLAPGIGTVTVVGNQVVCILANGSGAGGAQPEIVVVPSYDASAAIAYRVTESLVSSQAAFLTYTGGIGTLVALGGAPATFQFNEAVTANMLGLPDARSATISQGVPVGSSVNVRLDAEGF